MSIISGYEEQLKLCSTFTCSLSTPPWCACCLHAQIQYHHCIDKGKPDREERQEVCQEFPTAKGCQHPTAKGSQHSPRIHLSVSSIHSRSPINSRKLLGVGSFWWWGTIGRTLVFLLYLACPCLCNDDIESEHVDNRHTGGGWRENM